MTPRAIAGGVYGVLPLLGLQFGKAVAIIIVVQAGFDVGTAIYSYAKKKITEQVGLLGPTSRVIERNQEDT